MPLFVLKRPFLSTKRAALFEVFNQELIRLNEVVARTLGTELKDGLVKLEPAPEDLAGFLAMALDCPVQMVHVEDCAAAPASDRALRAYRGLVIEQETRRFEPSGYEARFALVLEQTGTATRHRVPRGVPLSQGQWARFEYGGKGRVFIEQAEQQVVG